MRASQPSLPVAAADTRTALIQAATAVFEEAGFRSATVRDICHRARANVAAVNYHFGDKETLYLEVLRHVSRTADARHPLPPAQADAGPEGRLEEFVHNFLLRLLDAGTDAAGSKLVSREMVNPSGVFATVVAEQFQPIADEVRSIVTPLLGRQASETAIRHCGISIVSQCLFYHQCRDVVAALFPDLDLSPAGIREVARHIVRFSLAGIRATADERERARKRGRSGP